MNRRKEKAEIKNKKLARLKNILTFAVPTKRELPNGVW